MNVLAWLTAGVAGWPWVRALQPKPSAPRWIRLGRDAALALAFGTGATACVFFVLIWAGLAPRAAAWAADGFVLAAGAGLWALRRNREIAVEVREPAAQFGNAWLPGIAAAVSVAAFLAALVLMISAGPQGDWDAWAIWNVRAKFLAHEGLWRNAVSPDLTATHPDYPLLWPAAVARAWSESGQIVPAAPQAGAFLAALTLVLLYACGLAARCGWQWSAAGTAALLMTVSLWRTAPGQYADVPLAMFLLGSVIAAAAAQQAGWSPAGLALSGTLASFAAFTKNEGLAFCVFLAGALAFAARQRALWWLAGAAPVLALTALFHRLLAPPKAMLSAASFQQPSRLAEVLKGMALEVWRLGDFPAHPLLFVLLLFFAFRPKWPWRPLWPAVAALLLLAADVAVLWGSSSDASWQVSTAGDRLLLHAAPVLLLCAFWWLARAQGAAVLAEPTPKPRRRKAGAESAAKS